jgi:hypothetical protein
MLFLTAASRDRTAFRGPTFWRRLFAIVFQALASASTLLAAECTSRTELKGTAPTAVTSPGHCQRMSWPIPGCRTRPGSNGASPLICVLGGREEVAAWQAGTWR